MILQPGIFVFIFLTCAAWCQTATSAPPATTQAPAETAPTPTPTPDSKQLIILKFHKPDYPLDAASKQIQGHVVIHLVITEAGDVETAEAVSGNSQLTDAAIRAMKTWKFKPYIRDGHPVRVSTSMPFDFAFSENVKDIPVSPTSTSAPAATTGSSASGPTAPVVTGSAVPAARINSPQTVRVTTGVPIGQPVLIHRVAPVYPSAARANHVQGTVVVQARINKEGRVEDVHVLSGPHELTEAATAAVEQWRYKPYYLNGEPVAVKVTINVNFTLPGY